MWKVALMKEKKKAPREKFDKILRQYNERIDEALDKRNSEDLREYTALRKQFLNDFEPEG